MPKKPLPTHTDDGIPIVNVSVPQIRKKQTTKGLIRIPHVGERSKCYVDAAKVIGEREALALPYHGGRMWKCEVKLTDASGATGSNYPTKSEPKKTNGLPTPLFRWYRSELQLATLPHILEDIIPVEHKMVHKKKWINLSNDEDDSSDEEWEEPEPELNVFEISNLTTAAYEDTTHPLPSISRSWISPDLQRFHSRKAAMAYAQELVDRDVLIDRVLYGYGKNGVRLRPVKPTRKAALEAGMARFLRDGLWIVGQEEMWIEKRRECFNRKNRMLLRGKDAIIDEGDPPWRTGGHPLIGRWVRYARKRADGKVVGWISETDVDSKGNPGFISTKTGVPANLFHVKFDDFEQDFEQFEVEKILIDDKEVNDGDVLENKLSSLAEKEKSCDTDQAVDATNVDPCTAQDATSDTSCTARDTNERRECDSELKPAAVEKVSIDEASDENPCSSINAQESSSAATPEVIDSKPTSAEIFVGENKSEAAAQPTIDNHVAQDKTNDTQGPVLTNRNNLSGVTATSVPEQKAILPAAKPEQSEQEQLEAVIKAAGSDNTASVKVTVKQSSTDNNADSGEFKTVTPNDSDASSHEGVAAKSSKPKVPRTYIEPLPPSTHYRLNEQQINKCYIACLEHYERVMHTVKARSLHHELADGFDVMRERGKGRFDMELPEFDTEDYSFLTKKNAAWMPIIHKILGDDAILVHKGCFLSLPGSDMQVYHQDGLHLHKKVQKPCHAVNVFIPLVDYDMSNGPTEFCLGSHYLGHENFVKEMAYTPLVEAGTPIMFDYRLGHRGLGNNSQSCRPVVYLTYSAVASGKEFRDEVNFSRKRYKKLGEFAEKPLSRDERAKKRKMWYM